MTALCVAQPITGAVPTARTRGSRCRAKAKPSSVQKAVAISAQRIALIGDAMGSRFRSWQKLRVPFTRSPESKGQQRTRAAALLRGHGGLGGGENDDLGSDGCAVIEVG